MITNEQDIVNLINSNYSDAIIGKNKFGNLIVGGPGDGKFIRGATGGEIIKTIADESKARDYVESYGKERID